MTGRTAADVVLVDDQSIRHNRQIMAYCAAAMYGAAALDGAIEMVLPNVPSFSLLPIYVVAAMTAFMFFAGPRLPRRVIMFNGPLGVALVSYALATTKVTASDSAVLFALPVLWQCLFFGRRGAVAILLLVAAGEALALHALGRYGYPERWVDVMVSTTAIALVVTDAGGSQRAPAGDALDGGAGRSAHRPAQPPRLRRAGRRRAQPGGCAGPARSRW